MKEIIAYIGDILGSLIIRIRIPKAPTPHSNALFAPLSDKNLPEKKNYKKPKASTSIDFFPVPELYTCICRNRNALICS